MLWKHVTYIHVFFYKNFVRNLLAQTFFAITFPNCIRPDCCIYKVKRINYASAGTLAPNFRKILNDIIDVL